MKLLEQFFHSAPRKFGKELPYKPEFAQIRLSRPLTGWNAKVNVGSRVPSSAPATRRTSAIRLFPAWPAKLLVPRAWREPQNISRLGEMAFFFFFI